MAGWQGVWLTTRLACYARDASEIGGKWPFRGWRLLREIWHTQSNSLDNYRTKQRWSSLMPRVTYSYLGKETIEEKSTVYQVCIKLHARSTAQTLERYVYLEDKKFIDYRQKLYFGCILTFISFDFRSIKNSSNWICLVFTEAAADQSRQSLPCRNGRLFLSRLRANLD
jgi:hypothetical protein